jgi:hypothetical protein
VRTKRERSISHSGSWWPATGGVWIHFLGGRRTRQARRCLELIEGGEPVALTDVILHADADFDRLASCSPLRIFA